MRCLLPLRALGAEGQTRLFVKVRDGYIATHTQAALGRAGGKGQGAVCGARGGAAGARARAGRGGRAGRAVGVAAEVTVELSRGTSEIPRRRDSSPNANATCRWSRIGRLAGARGLTTIKEGERGGAVVRLQRGRGPSGAGGAGNGASGGGKGCFAGTRRRLGAVLVEVAG